MKILESRGVFGITLASTLMLSNCATDSMSVNQIGGAVGGALVGGLVCAASDANDTECAALILAGALAGYGIGKHIDARDKAAYERARVAALNAPVESTEAVFETSEETGNTIEIQPTSVYVNDAGRQCKTFDSTYMKGEEKFVEKEVFCQNADGNWEPQES